MALFDSAGRGYNLTGEASPSRCSGVRVTASFFDVLGVAPLLGRTFRPEEEMPGSDRVVVLSHGLWTRRYAADRAYRRPDDPDRRAAVHRRRRDAADVQVPSLAAAAERQLWVPAGWTEGDDERGSNSFIAIGRLKPDRSFEEAREPRWTRSARARGGASRDLTRTDGADRADDRVSASARLRPTLFAMLGVVGFVLLIACVNVANLMLARAARPAARARHPLRARRRTRRRRSGSCSPRACCSRGRRRRAGCSSPYWGTRRAAADAARRISATCRCGRSTSIGIDTTGAAVHLGGRHPERRAVRSRAGARRRSARTSTIR